LSKLNVNETGLIGKKEVLFVSSLVLLVNQNYE